MLSWGKFLASKSHSIPIQLSQGSSHSLPATVSMKYKRLTLGRNSQHTMRCQLLAQTAQSSLTLFRPQFSQLTWDTMPGQIRQWFFHLGVSRHILSIVTEGSQNLAQLFLGGGGFDSNQFLDPLEIRSVSTGPHNMPYKFHFGLPMSHLATLRVMPASLMISKN